MSRYSYYDGTQCTVLWVAFSTYQMPRYAVKAGLVRDLNPGPLAPKARIIPLDQRASVLLCICANSFEWLMERDAMKQHEHCKVDDQQLSLRTWLGLASGTASFLWR